MQLLETIKDQEIYQTLKNSLELKEGFGLFFIICTPAQAQNITIQLKEDFAQLKNIQSLTLTKEVTQLHQKITSICQENPVDILLISGIEKSFDPYVKSGVEATEKYGGKGGYYQLDLASLPPLLTHLNLQRESYKKSFLFSLVFFLSPFAYRFLIRRASDFIDWRSGVFEFPKNPQEVERETQRIINEGDYDKYITWTPEARQAEIKNIKELIKETYLSDETKSQLYFEIGLLNSANEDYTYAVKSFDQALKFKPDKHQAWYNRGNALRNLGRNEEAIQSYDQALKFKPDLFVLA